MDDNGAHNQLMHGQAWRIPKRWLIGKGSTGMANTKERLCIKSHRAILQKSLAL